MQKIERNKRKEKNKSKDFIKRMKKWNELEDGMKMSQDILLVISNGEAKIAIN